LTASGFAPLRRTRSQPRLCAPAVVSQPRQSGIHAENYGDGNHQRGQRHISPAQPVMRRQAPGERIEKRQDDRQQQRVCYLRTVAEADDVDARDDKQRLRNERSQDS
jgi:hypothetical protein